MTRSGIDLTALDPDVRPQDDLYAHVNGRWLAAHVIPADRAMDGAFRALHDRAEEQVRDIIADAGASAAAGTSTDPVEAKVGAVYASFMDTDAVEAAGVAPLRTDLALVEAATTQAELTGALGALQRTGAGGAVGFYVDNDAKEPTRYVVHLAQGGLGLPDEAYYRDAQYAPVLAAYRPHVARMLRLGGAAADEAQADELAGRVLALETALAAGHWDVVKDRDADLTYNALTLTDARRACPRVRLALLGAGARRAGHGVRPPRRARAVLRRGVRRPVGERAARGLEGVAQLPRHLRPGAVPERRAGRGELRLLRPDAHGCAGAARPLEARRLAGAGRARRGRRQGLRRPALPGGAQGADGGAGGQPRRRVPRVHLAAGLDGRGDAREGARQARGVHPEDRLPRPLARLLDARGVRGRPAGQRAPRVRVRAGPRAGQDRQADRPRRVVHDPADGQRVLQPRAERDRVPGRHPAAAVLRRRRRRRRQLRRDRCRHRPRDRPRVRRPGVQVRRRRAPRGLVDGRRPRGVRVAHQGADRPVLGVLPRPAGRVAPRERRAHHRREHRRPRRAVHRVHAPTGSRSAPRSRTPP